MNVLVEELKHLLFLFLGNHSCEPNAEVTFPYNNSTVVVKALRPIASGEVHIK